jgi:hypothetical protein
MTEIPITWDFAALPERRTETNDRIGSRRLAVFWDCVNGRNQKGHP